MTITTIPPASYHKPLSVLSSRQLESSFGNEHSAPVLSTTQNNQHSIFGICHDSESTCIRATNNCSSHGSCVESMTSNGCWTCLCVPSVRQVGDGTGRQTTYWAGEQCQKQDISVQFHLFFWVLSPLPPRSWMLWLIEVYGCVGVDYCGGSEITLERR